MFGCRHNEVRVADGEGRMEAASWTEGWTEVAAAEVPVPVW